MQRNTSSRRNQWGISKQGPQAGKNQLCPTTTGSCEKDILGKTRAAALLPACKLFRVKSHGLFVSVLPGLSTVLPTTGPWSVFSVSQPTACTATLAGSGPPDALPIMTKEGWQTGPAALCWRQTLVSTGLTWILGPNPSTGEGAPACPQNATLTSGATGGTEAPFVV